MNKIIISLALFFSTIVGLWWWNKSKIKNTKPTTTRITKRTLIDKRYITGKIIPRKEIEVRSHISGVVDKLYIDIGDQVKKGDPLARISVQPTLEEIENAQKKYRIALIKLKSIEKEYNSEKILFDKGLTSEAKYDTIRQKWILAQEEFNSAKSNIIITEKGYLPSTQGKVDNNIILATISGTVLEVPKKEGASITRNTKSSQSNIIAIIADMKNLLFQGNITEVDIAALKKGMKFNLAISALKGHKVKAVLTQIAPKGKSSNNSSLVTFEIKAKIIHEPKDSCFIRAGYSASAELILQQGNDVWSLEEQHIFTENSLSHHYVWVLKDGGIKKREVKLGMTDGIHREIKSGLDSSDLIITNYEEIKNTP